MSLWSPARPGGLVRYLPQFLKVFYRLMKDARVSWMAKLVPFLGLALMFTPPALELDVVPFIGELDWLLAIYLSLRLFLWLCPADVVREHVAQVGRGA
ncbi:MAG TPA: hypothetical protein VFB15_10495 [Candidatus Binataceae bacterium]|nr:hypothetical protein [Candidatus Binataceae bacterium]